MRSRFCHFLRQSRVSGAVRLRKFSATFSSRAPPLELRMLLPDLEAQHQAAELLCQDDLGVSINGDH